MFFISFVFLSLFFAPCLQDVQNDECFQGSSITPLPKNPFFFFPEINFWLYSIQNFERAAQESWSIISFFSSFVRASSCQLNYKRKTHFLVVVALERKICSIHSIIPKLYYFFFLQRTKYYASWNIMFRLVLRRDFNNICEISLKIYTPYFCFVTMMLQPIHSSTFLMDFLLFLSVNPGKKLLTNFLVSWFQVKTHTERKWHVSNLGNGHKSNPGWRIQGG